MKPYMRTYSAYNTEGWGKLPNGNVECSNCSAIGLALPSAARKIFRDIILHAGVTAAMLWFTTVSY